MVWPLRRSRRAGRWLLRRRPSLGGLLLLAMLVQTAPLHAEAPPWTDVPAVIASIPGSRHDRGGTRLDETTLKAALDSAVEVGRYIYAPPGSFNGNGIFYRIRYTPGKYGDADGTLSYADNRNERQSGYYSVISGRGLARLCRARAAVELPHQCHAVFHIKGNLYEARGVPSDTVRYRFRLFSIEGAGIDASKLSLPAPDSSAAMPATDETSPEGGDTGKPDYLKMYDHIYVLPNESHDQEQPAR